MKRNENENLVLHRFSSDTSTLSINEFVPGVEKTDGELTLCWDSSGNIRWKPILHANQLLDSISGITQIHFDSSRIGIGRYPLHNYRVDLSVPVNTLMTAFHLGDGSYGMSFGNATTQGFLPQILGMGSDENDAGLYLLGKTGSSLSSSVPLVIIDGRNTDNTALHNRPILGVTSGDYSEYKLIIDQMGRLGVGTIPRIYKMEVGGTVRATDVVCDGSISLKELHEEIQLLKTKIKELEEK